MSEENISRGTSPGIPSNFGERLRFVMWLSALELGVWSSKEFAVAAKKRENQISRWAREDPKPGWEITKGLALMAGVSPAWLDDPRTLGAHEPPLFDQWLESRRRWLASQQPKEIQPIKPKDVARLVAERHDQVYGAKKKRKSRRSK